MPFSERLDEIVQQYFGIGVATTVPAVALTVPDRQVLESEPQRGSDDVEREIIEVYRRHYSSHYPEGADLAIRDWCREKLGDWQREEVSSFAYIIEQKFALTPTGALKPTGANSAFKRSPKKAVQEILASLDDTLNEFHARPTLPIKD